MIIWSAGWNMPGYLPETEPCPFKSRPDAMAYMVGELHRIGDTDLAVAEDYEAQALSLEGRDADGGDWYWLSPDGYAYWVEAVDLPDDEARAFLAAGQ